MSNDDFFNEMMSALEEMAGIEIEGDGNDVSHNDITCGGTTFGAVSSGFSLDK